MELFVELKHWDSEASGVFLSGVDRVSEKILYVFTVAMDAWTESADRVLNNVDEKFGIPQLKQIQLVLDVRPL